MSPMIRLRAEISERSWKATRKFSNAIHVGRDWITCYGSSLPMCRLRAPADARQSSPTRQWRNSSSHFALKSVKYSTAVPSRS